MSDGLADTGDIVQGGLLLAFALLVLVFAILKTAFRFLTPFAAENLIEREGLGEDSFLRKSLRHPTPLWFSLQIGGLLSLLGLAWTFAARPFLAGGRGWTPVHLVGTAIAGILSFVCLELLIPSFVVRGREDRVLVGALPILRAVHRVFSPVARWLAGLVEREDERNVSAAAEEAASAEEVEAFIEVGEQEGILDEGEGEMIKGVVDFGDMVVREVMTPRPDLVAVPEDATVEGVCRLMVRAKRTKIPIYGRNVDDIQGVLHIKDLLDAFLRGEGPERAAPLARPAVFVPETMPVLGVLRDLQRRRLSLAVVLDEYGATSGIVTVPDLVEEIVGEIRDEHEAAPPDIAVEAEGVWAVDGRASLDDVREAVHAPLDVNEDVDTAGGFLVARFGRVPRPGERLGLPGLEFLVLDADDRRVLRLRVRRLGADGDGEERSQHPAQGV